jgi:hypothetical protein
MTLGYGLDQDPVHRMRVDECLAGVMRGRYRVRSVGSGQALHLVTELPRNASMKVRKADLRAEFARAVREAATP